MRHELKTWVASFTAIIEGRKLHEVRYDDRNYQENDTLFLREYIKEEDRYTGRAIEVKVTYLSRGPAWGLPADVVVMSVLMSSELILDSFPAQQDDPEVTRDLLSLAGAEVPVEVIQAWSPSERKEADEWAGGVCLQATSDVVVPPKPKHVTRDEIKG